MIIAEQVRLSSLTTLRVGGPTRFVAHCRFEADVREALAYAKSHGLPFRVLGQGSNVLAHDSGYEGMVLLMESEGIEEVEEKDAITLVVEAGVSWDALVTYAAELGLWGIENLAGIPGTVGAAPVQNIGAYGSEVKDTIVSVRALVADTGEIQSFTHEECGFGYRESRFKHDSSLIILSVSFRLMREGRPQVSYKDVAAYEQEHDVLATPLEVNAAVRSIRARKFPDLREFGTAGSFFKNPTISEEAYARLLSMHPELPGFPNADGVKIPLAFILDKVLNLRGYTKGNVSLFREQPLVLVAGEGATAAEIDAFAKVIEENVASATGIHIEREVRAFP